MAEIKKEYKTSIYEKPARWRLLKKPYSQVVHYRYLIGINFCRIVIRGTTFGRINLCEFAIFEKYEDLIFANFEI